MDNIFNTAINPKSNKIQQMIYKARVLAGDLPDYKNEAFLTTYLKSQPQAALLLKIWAYNYKTDMTFNSELTTTEKKALAALMKKKLVAQTSTGYTIVSFNFVWFFHMSQYDLNHITF